MRNSALNPRVIICALLLCLGGSPSCMHRPIAKSLGLYRYFEVPDSFDAWSLKIGRWQQSQQTEALESGAKAQPTEADTLGARFERVRERLRREQAQRVASWIQEEARAVYSEDTKLDHWPTLDEVLASESDDCDGLELMVHELLLDLGFPADRVYRAVVYRPTDGQYHMVTLWFEDEQDPWVIDPTGAMTLGMPRMSEVPEWVPLKLFSATQEFTVRSQLP